MNDVFICYSPEDENIASDICNFLENNNYKCWYKKRDYSQDDSIIKVTEAIRDSRSFLLIYSNDSKISNFVTTEIDIAFSSNIPIFVFNIDDSTFEGKIQFYLKDKPLINAYPNAQEHYDEILKDVNEILGENSNGNDIIESDENDAYICYSDEDVLTAEAITHVLEENGIRCWFKKRDLKVSETIEKVPESIKNSKSFVLIYSDSASKSNFVKTDTDLAISSNIPILSFKIDDIEKTEEISDSHWLDAYPNPEDNFKNLVINVSNIIGKPIDNPKVTKNEVTSKKSKNNGLSNRFKIIVIVAVIIVLVACVAYFITSTTTDIASEVNIPDGFHEVTDYAYTENNANGYYQYKFYQNDNNDYFDVSVDHNNQPLVLSDEPGYADKTINGIDGKYNDNKTEFKYLDSKGNMIMISASSEELFQKIVK